MKKLLFLYSLIFFISGNAQDLRDYIPSNANLVGSINGGAILDASTLDNPLKHFNFIGENSPINRILTDIINFLLGLSVLSHNNFVLHNSYVQTFF